MTVALFILKNKGRNKILEVIKFLEKVRNTVHPQPLALFVSGFAYQSKINTWLILVNSRICHWNCPCLMFTFCLVIPLEHGQKFPGLRPADAAGLNGSQQKWAETGPGRACSEASADWIQPRASEECQTALWVALPQNTWLACGAASRGHLGCILIPQLLPYCHLSGRRLPQRHFQTNPHTRTRGQAGASALLPNFGDTFATDRTKWVFIVCLCVFVFKFFLSYRFFVLIILRCFKSWFSVHMICSGPQQWETAGQSMHIWVNTEPSRPDQKCSVRKSKKFSCTVLFA